jgi:hypothetical protein
MAQRWRIPKDPPKNGDDPSLSPDTNERSLLAADATGKTRRIFVDEENNLLVRDVSSGVYDLSVLSVGETGAINAETLTTITSYAAASDIQLSKVSCSGEGAADFTLWIDTTQIDIKRSDTLDLDKEFKFDDPLPVSSGSVISIRVYHHATGKTKNFNATIYGA